MLSKMWSEIFRDPFATNFPRVQASGSPFVGFGGFYGEKPRSFWEDPVYFPTFKPRKVSNRKKARRQEEDRQSDDNNERIAATRQKDRENPSTKRDDTKLKEQKQTCPSQPKLSQAAMDDIPIPIEILPREENVFSHRLEEPSKERPPCDGRRGNELSAQRLPVKNTPRDGCASQVNQTTADVENAEGRPQAGSLVVNETQSATQPAEEQKLNAIETQLTKAKKLIARVAAFEGSKQDKEYLYLEEHLTRCILSLDLIETDGHENVKSARRAAVKEILSIVSDLEARVRE